MAEPDYPYCACDKHGIAWPFAAHAAIRHRLCYLDGYRGGGHGDSGHFSIWRAGLTVSASLHCINRVWHYWLEVRASLIGLCYSHHRLTQSLLFASAKVWEGGRR